MIKQQSIKIGFILLLVVISFISCDDNKNNCDEIVQVVFEIDKYQHDYEYYKEISIIVDSENIIDNTEGQLLFIKTDSLYKNCTFNYIDEKLVIKTDFVYSVGLNLKEVCLSNIELMEDMGRLIVLSSTDKANRKTFTYDICKETKFKFIYNEKPISLDSLENYELKWPEIEHIE